ncbi:Undecaprenyl-phosphate N-acetylglucosaminyl 1-phosphate transferase [Rhodovastum atsumiense]|uniref:Undecaprenyl/decaprenyl-phosphate alpha-N-acetylglucosaminyl 1-phosphate transferase n=1 Tax=Rhodovastum atsumiense TaxID=504468 RepID=A0A5M6IZE2_9PROT|nr:MraY family glycosyltransferase [Rhodovastum atsumiense]KAA5613663.1 undecaprenyl/decaprenyl-phosphate alpha-N-acetylglucosaminyl 1-phosphate transferase [Rhodovastum atsumiense]CAH2599574.1 Undecaprenyl-phosphate N-acetylglucosaminyl 1-phosphate transferase [Rhodovastum atsumiense]
MTLVAILRHLAFAGGLALVSAVVVRAMINARVMDLPNDRSSHTVPTPRGGGMGIVVAFLLGIGFLYGFASFARLADPYFRGVIMAAIVIAVVGFIDDLRDWPFSVKLAAQLLAALAAVGSGLFLQVFRIPVLGPVDIGWLAGAAITVGWILFATNAMNFIDGLNGLAAGTTLVASLCLAAIAAGQGGWFVYFASVLLAAGVAGFLPFNFPRARIFMGDVGSQFCGFVLAVLGIAASRFDKVELSFLLVPMLLSGVLFDVAFTLLRRALAGERLTQAHRGHLYQVAQRSGMDARLVAATHWGFAALGGLACLGFMAAPGPVKPLVPLLLLIPQIAWATYVAARARRAGLGRW